MVNLAVCVQRASAGDFCCFLHSTNDSLQKMSSHGQILLCCKLTSLIHPVVNYLFFLRIYVCFKPATLVSNATTCHCPEYNRIVKKSAAGR